MGGGVEVKDVEVPPPSPTVSSQLFQGGSLGTTALTHLPSFELLSLPLAHHISEAGRCFAGDCGVRVPVPLPAVR